MKLEPLPIIDCTSMSPPRAYAIFLLIVRPNPTPSLLSSRLSMILVKLVNNLATYVFVMPTPVSSIMIRSFCFFLSIIA
jgi:hypothetical protein